MENFNENVVENNINEEFEGCINNDIEFNTDDENEGGSTSVVGIVARIAFIGGAVKLAYEGCKRLRKKAKEKSKAKLIEELKAEGWVNPYEETEDNDAVECDVCDESNE